MMSTTGKHRRKFTPEYRRETARLVIDTGRSIAQVTREIGVGEASLGRWVCSSRNDVVGGAEQFVPLGTGQRDVGSGSGFDRTGWAGGAEDDLQVRRVTGDPSGGDAHRSDTVLLGQAVKDGVQVGVPWIAQEDAGEETALEG